MPSSFTSKCLLVQSLLLLLAFSTNAASSYWTVKSLPGFSGELPFTLETGYVSLGDIEYFYYFVESESDQPGLDPLILYINGGPGCSGLNGLVYQAGPLEFNLNYSGHGIPELLYVPYSWTKTSNIIFLDAPVGAGFSYATNASSYTSSDTIASAHILSFLRSWLEDHLDFKDNPFFLSSDSYAGIYVPMIAQAKINNNEAGELKPRINLKGYMISCPHTDKTLESNSQIVFAHRMALISDAMYMNAKRSCNGSYVDIAPSNAKCFEALEAITLSIQDINTHHILSPNCAFISPESTGEEGRRSLSENSRNDFLSSFKAPDLSCHLFNYLLSDLWTNYEPVQEALHVRPGTVKQWWRCNNSLSYTYNVKNVVPYHKNLTETGLQVLALSGDHDMVVSHIASEDWIASLDLTVDYDWRPWFLDGQVAGYNIRYTNDGYRFTYATIKGAGHSPAEWKRKEVYEMFNRWIHYKAI